MGFALDSIIKQKMIDSPTTINSAYTSNSVDIDKVEGDFAISFEYDNGSTVDMDLSLEVSNDNVSFSEITDSIQNITDNSGLHIFDVTGTGTSFVRVKVAVTTGSIDIQSIDFVGDRRH